ncbi:uncharacterized protein LOC122573018 [Bombus pyrosoma]|uniref:Uncharacterized protein LOC117208344 n=1 Tax=Bombus bifarius TaxID=103933 RepID=A0A6P8MB77_9HYME|nr:uncharacterized protein LOC117158031 [Bombus vancouverensis nearcticus]XP_033305373.1 uncharacterized protein LOC117208344 [Bombus bifarius]XP_043594792.1 uncharacterized protein LOC122573018 [Bombus pyrosoma]
MHGRSWYQDGEDIVILAEGEEVLRISLDKKGETNWSWLKDVFDIQRRPSLQELIADWPILATVIKEKSSGSRRPSLAELIPDWPTLHHFTKTEVGSYSSTT